MAVVLTLCLAAAFGLLLEPGLRLHPRTHSIVAGGKHSHSHDHEAAHEQPHSAAAAKAADHSAEGGDSHSHSDSHGDSHVDSSGAHDSSASAPPSHSQRQLQFQLPCLAGKNVNMRGVLNSGVACLRTGAGMGVAIPCAIISLGLCWQRLAGAAAQADFIPVPLPQDISAPTPPVDDSHSMAPLFILGAGLGLMIAGAVYRYSTGEQSQKAYKSLLQLQPPVVRRLRTDLQQALSTAMSSKGPVEDHLPEQYTMFTPQVSPGDDAPHLAQAA